MGIRWYHNLSWGGQEATLFFCAQEQQAAAFSGGVPTVEVHAVPEGVEGVGDVGLVLVGFFGRVRG